MKVLGAAMLVLGAGCAAAATPATPRSEPAPALRTRHVSAQPDAAPVDRTHALSFAAPARDEPRLPVSAEWARLELSSAPPARSERLGSGLFNPMPGGQLAGYRIDTGLDIAGSPRVVHAIADGTLDYSEPGHTRWTGPGDNANCVRLRLDVPIDYKGRKVTHAWYAHLSALRWIQAEGGEARVHVSGGEPIGISGRARGMPHLHLGLLLDGEVEQEWGTYLLEDEVRDVLGAYRNFARLPAP